MQNNVPETRKRKQPHGAWPVPGGGAAPRRGRRPRRSASARRRAVRVRWAGAVPLPARSRSRDCALRHGGRRPEVRAGTASRARVSRQCGLAWRSRWGAAAAVPCRALPDRRGDQIDDIAYWSTCIITYSDLLSGVRRLTQCAGHSSPVGSAFQLSRRPRHSRCYVHRLPWRAWIPSSVPHLQPYTQYWALNKACTLQTCHTISMRVSLEQC